MFCFLFGENKKNLYRHAKLVVCNTYILLKYVVQSLFFFFSKGKQSKTVFFSVHTVSIFEEILSLMMFSSVFFGQGILFTSQDKHYIKQVTGYPTALKGCRGIVFTHGVWMGGWAGGGKKFVRAVSQKP